MNSMNSMNNLPVVADVEIPVDKEGRYNLNALHKASGLGENRAPAKWSRNAQVKELVGVLEQSTGQICLAAHEGAFGGTYAHELLAIEYAGWISPVFRLKVNQAFIDFRQKKFEVDYQSARDLAFKLVKEANRVAAADGWNLISRHIDMQYVDQNDRKEARISEAQLINWVVLGMTATEFKKWFDAPGAIRDHMHPAQTQAISEIENLNYGFIMAGLSWEQRKEALELVLMNKFPHVRRYRNEVLTTIKLRSEKNLLDLFPTHPKDSDLLNSGGMLLTVDSQLKQLK